MSYEPTTWRTGDVVTSAKLNKLERGVADAGGATIVHADLSADDPTLDMTAGAIMTAIQTGPVFLCETYPGYGTVAAGPVSISMNQSGAYTVKGISENVNYYRAASADAYPSANGGGGDGGDSSSH